MRTIHTVTTESEDRVLYYEADDSLVDAQDRYYVQTKAPSETEQLTQAIYAGRLAMEEQLEGPVIRDDFKALFRGILPRSEQRIRGERPKVDDKERYAYDLVLSSPKSVAEALYLEGDLRLFDCHMEAAKDTLAVVETELARTRIQSDGVRQSVNTGKLLAVMLPHHTSRDGDMQLHTHILIMNGTKGPDGVWRSLCHESLAKAEWIGSFFRQRLAEKVQPLGYQIYNTDSGFELQGYRRHDIELFSKRHRAIVEAVQKEGLTVNPETKKQKVLPTRKPKSPSNSTLEEHQFRWRDEARSHQVSRPVLGDPIYIQPDRNTAIQEVNDAIRFLSKRSVSFSRYDIWAYAYQHIHADGLSLEHINQTIDQHTSLHDLGNDRFTTPAAQGQELEIRQRWMAGQGQATPLGSEFNLVPTQLNPGQAEVVSRTLCSTDAHQIIPRLSRDATIKILRELARQVNRAEVTIRGVSPTVESAANLQEDVGLKTTTVEHLILNQPDSARNQLWVVEQAGLLSADKILRLQRQAEAVQARILLVEDKRQNSSAVDGSPLRSLINYGATTHSIHQILHQQRSMQQQAVTLLAQGNQKKALELLLAHGSIREIPHPQDRATAIAKQYLALSQKQRNQTVIKTGTPDEGLRITQVIRTQLKAEGKLGDSVQTVQLVSRQLTNEQSKDISNYQIGNYIKLRRNYQSTSLKQGHLYKVEALRGDELVVSSFGGRLLHFNPSQYKDTDVFQSQRLEIAVGDQVRWTCSDKSKGQMNGENATVALIEATSLTLIDLKGKSCDVSLLQPLALDYAWVSPLNQSPRKPVKQVIISATRDSISAQEHFHIPMGRQVKDINVYTENLQGIYKAVQGVSPAISLELKVENNRGYRKNRGLAATLQSSQVSQKTLDSDCQLGANRGNGIEGARPHSPRNQAQSSNTVRLPKPDVEKIAGVERQQCPDGKRPVDSEEQDKLNQQALDSSKQFLRKFGMIQPSKELSWTSGSYTLCADKKRLSVCCHQRGSILELQGEKLTGRVTPRDVQRFKELEKTLKQTTVVQSLEMD